MVEAGFPETGYPHSPMQDTDLCRYMLVLIHNITEKTVFFTSFDCLGFGFFSSLDKIIESNVKMKDKSNAMNYNRIQPNCTDSEQKQNKNFLQ